MSRCNVCFRHCDIPEGGLGFCGARTCSGGEVRAANYGRVTSLALDPIEKKPLNRFFPGSMILSLGSYGCNLRCPFCQNHDISWSEQARQLSDTAETATPEEIARTAEYYRSRGNIGVAFTYNEPLIGYEFVRDTAKLVHERGMVNLLVTNGTAEPAIFEELARHIDAANIDLKGFTDRYYKDVLGGSREQVMDLIARAVQVWHVELTTLIVPGENDSEAELREMCEWIAGLKDAHGNVIGKDIPLHISRFFPRFKMTDRGATDISLIYQLAETARSYLRFVYTGNC